MSTNHILFDKKDGSMVELYEHSNLFDLDCTPKGDCGVYTSVGNLTLDQIKGLVNELSEVISYYDPDYKPYKELQCSKK